MTVPIFILCLARVSGYATAYGERVVAMGDSPELGQWDPRRAVPLEYVNQNLWMGDLPFEASAGREVLYRYAIVDGDLVKLEIDSRLVVDAVDSLVE